MCLLAWSIGSSYSVLRASDLFNWPSFVLELSKRKYCKEKIFIRAKRKYFNSNDESNPFLMHIKKFQFVSCLVRDNVLSTFEFNAV